MKRLHVLCVALMTLFVIACGTTNADHHKNKKEDKKAKLGEKAPDFTLPNLEGKKVSLSDYTKKDQYVILEWMNPDCPYCTRVHKSGIVNRMLENVRKLTDGNVVHIEINSTHYMGPEKTGKYLKEHGVQSTALMDKSGKVGRLYDAKTTPHMYVIDKKGILRYRGAIDDDVKGRKSPDERTNYVVNAIKQLTSGKDVGPNKTKPYGCSVKYPKN